MAVGNIYEPDHVNSILTAGRADLVALGRFAHVDPAGIVFYPRYFEMLNGAIKDFFAEAVGVVSPRTA